MSVTSGQVPVPPGGTVLTRLPAGLASVTISNAGTAPIYVAASSTLGTLSPTGGMPVPSGGIFTFALFAGQSRRQPDRRVGWRHVNSRFPHCY